MASMKSAKGILRKEVKKKIDLLDENKKYFQSKIVTKKVVNSQFFKKSNRISVYISRSDEVQTHGIIKEIFNMGKLCFIPRYSTENIHMEMVKLLSIQELDEFSLTKWNIKQPAERDERENALHSGGLDLIFVPGIAFTKTGKRLGRGKGFYDKFLTECLASQNVPPVTVGLAFEEQICQDIPTDPHDFKLDIVVHPNYKS